MLAIGRLRKVHGKGSCEPQEDSPRHAPSIKLKGCPLPVPLSPPILWNSLQDGLLPFYLSIHHGSVPQQQWARHTVQSGSSMSHSAVRLKCSAFDSPAAHSFSRAPWAIPSYHLLFSLGSQGRVKAALPKLGPYTSHRLLHVCWLQGCLCSLWTWPCQPPAFLPIKVTSHPPSLTAILWFPGAALSICVYSNTTWRTQDTPLTHALATFDPSQQKNQHLAQWVSLPL